jgi:4'-phosphopantetheinyl transferase
MDVYWLEQAEADVPVGNDWLSARELACLSRLRFPKRRADWRLGRWTAKCILADYLKTSPAPKVLATIELHPSASGAPEVFFENNSSAVVISLSHRAGIAACAVAPSGGALGCDLEMIEPRSDAFVADYFTTEEQALVAQAPAADRFRLLALLWSAKESALKALRAGLRLDTRSVIVGPIDAPGDQEQADTHCGKDPTLTGGSQSDLRCWRPLQVRHTDGQTFHGWWQQAGILLRTVVATPPPSRPILVTRDPVSAGV